MPSIRLGTASPQTQPTLSETLTLLSSLTQRASAKSIDILLLPEAFLGGYPRGHSFGSVIGERKDSGRDDFAAYFGAAVDLGDTVDYGAGAGDAWVNRELGEGRGDGTRERLEKIAAETGIFIVVGVVEKAGGSLYCSVVYVCPEKGVIGKRRKVMPTGAERLIWAQGSPSTLKAITTTIRGTRINLAAAICWESYMPLLRQSLYAQNVNLYLAPTADGRDTWLSLMKTVGIEGRCFVVSSNMATKGKGDGVKGGADGEKLPLLPSPRRKRRKSVFDDDGNEIVLCCPADDPKPTNGENATLPLRRANSVACEEAGMDIALPKSPTQQPPTQTNQHTHPLPLHPVRTDSVACEEERMDIALPKISPRTTKRRKSIIDEDGNEIVLCCSEDTAFFPSPTDKPTSPTMPKASPTNFPKQPAEANKPTSLRSSTKNAWTSRGGSCIISPFGSVLAGPQWEDDEGLIYADVDFKDCIKGRLDFDAAGSYSRNDSFKFSVEGLDLDPLPY